MSSKVVISSKKRRVVSKNTSESSSSLSSRESKRSKHGSSERTPYSEEKELEVRTVNQDLELHKATCSKIHNFLKEIRDLKSEEAESNSSEIAEKRSAVAVQFISLKKLNRLSHLRCKSAKDRTQTAKHKVDGLHLQLQNLQYEIMHLQKEITKCLEFKSNDEEVELVDLETFYKEAPKDISRPRETKNDPHKQRLARLDWELELRKRLSKKLDESQSNRDIVAQEIKTKQEYLSSLQPRLQSILQATTPVQQYLSMPFQEIRSQNKTARLLPRPLYVLFLQASAYSTACDSLMTVTIEGDSDSAMTAVPTSSMMDEDSDSDNEETLSQSKRRRKTIGDKQEERKKTLLAKHPLQIIITLEFKDTAQLVLTFSYMMVLQVVTVHAKLAGPSGSDSVPLPPSDLLAMDNFLNSLYPGQTGKESPNAANRYQLKRIGLDSNNAYFKEIGIPYLWCQWIAGLDFLQSDVPVSPQKASTNVSSSHMEATMKALRSRVKARLALQKQIVALSNREIQVPNSIIKKFPPKLSTRLSSWKTIQRENLENFPFALSHPALANRSDADDLFMYVVTCERGTAKLQAVVLVSQDYPIDSPMFIINLVWHGSHSAENDNDIRDMETEVNVHTRDLMTPKSLGYLLSCQVQHLLMCLDLYLEAASLVSVTDTTNPGEFPREKMFVRNARGRSRSKPLKYNPLHGYFIQR